MIYIMAILMMLAAVVAPFSLEAAAIDVEEIGSFHIGGRPITLSGLPLRQLAFTVGAPPLLVDSNGVSGVNYFSLRRQLEFPVNDN